jgi:hypothetical protein
LRGAFGGDAALFGKRQAFLYHVAAQVGINQSPRHFGG